MPALAQQLLAQPRLQQTVSPQLILQSHLLALSAEDLHDRVRAELDENPALELVEDLHFLPPAIAAPACETIDTADHLRAPHTLADDLRLQLLHADPPLRALCDYLIDCLDDRGFLDADLREIAAHFGLTVRDVESALSALQSLEPPGIAARNLCECLLLQVQRLPEHEVPPHTAAFISLYLSTDRRGNASRTADALGLTDAHIARIVKFIGSRLHMWPADKFHDEYQDRSRTDAPVFADAWIVYDGDDLRVHVAQSWSHALRVSEAYARLESELRHTTGAPAPHEHIAEKIRAARAFIHHLTRRETMLKHVVEGIVDAQRDFFTDGPRALRPLTRKQLAARLDVHESTISRITSDKHLRLPSEQLVPFDFFFDASLSAKSVLRSLIERDDPRRPLSDGVLADRLQSAGYPLARRTVAKYRDQLHLPPAHLRKSG